ncbi:MAG: SDR family NAD(P)-dependent oxidoreductase [Planctomycetota bacterium]
MISSDAVVLLAGASGELGRAVARSLLDRGARVAAAVARAWQVEKLQEQLRDDLGAAACDRLLASVVAPRDAQAAAGFVKGSRDALGTVTDYVAASRLWHNAQAGKEPAADLEELLDANLFGNATLARALLPSFRRARAGRLQFLVAAEDGDAWLRASASTRASLSGLRSYAEALRDELANDGDAPCVSLVAVDGSGDGSKDGVSAQAFEAALKAI